MIISGKLSVVCLTGQTTEEYEPRVELVSIDFEEDAASGVIIPVVEVEINE